MMGMHMPILASGGSSWTIGNALSALQETVGNYGKVIIGIIGLVMVIVSVYQIAKNLISHGKGQTNWVITFALLLVGGALLLASGWDLLVSIANGGQSTIDDLGQGNADKAEFRDPSGSGTALIGGNWISFE